MKLLLALRLLAFVVAGVSLALAFVGVAAPRLSRIGRFALLGGAAAQLTVDVTNARAGRAPWSRIVLALLACAASLEFLITGQLPVAAMFALGAIEASIIGFVVIRALADRQARETDDSPEDTLRGAFARFAPVELASFLAVESTIVVGAIRFACGGFRKARPMGFSYDRQSMVTPFLLFSPLLLLPEMFVLDVILWHAPWGWRALNDGVHLYALLWAFGLVALLRDRPHQVHAERVVFRCGPFKRLVVPRASIGNATVVPQALSERDVKRLADGDPRLLLPGVPTVCIDLNEPLAGARRIFVSADDPSGLIRALQA